VWLWLCLWLLGAGLSGAVGESVEEKARRARRRCYMLLGGGAQAANDAIRAPITGKAAAAGTFLPLPAMLSHSRLCDTQFAVCCVLAQPPANAAWPGMRCSLVVNADNTAMSTCHHRCARLPAIPYRGEHCSCDVLSGLTGTHLGLHLPPFSLSLRLPSSMRRKI
jgi:hypothetical protein